MGVFCLNLCDFGVGSGPPDEPLEGADDVAEVGDLEGLCGLSDRALLGTEGDQGSI